MASMPPRTTRRDSGALLTKYSTAGTYPLGTFRVGAWNFGELEPLPQDFGGAERGGVHVPTLWLPPDCYRHGFEPRALLLQGDTAQLCAEQITNIYSKTDTPAEFTRCGEPIHDPKPIPLYTCPVPVLTILPPLVCRNSYLSSSSL